MFCHTLLHILNRFSSYFQRTRQGNNTNTQVSAGLALHNCCGKAMLFKCLFCNFNVLLKLSFKLTDSMQYFPRSVGSILHNFVFLFLCVIFIKPNKNNFIKFVFTRHVNYIL